MEAEGGALAFSVDGDGEFFDFLGDILGDESPETKKVQVTQAQEPSASCMNRTHTSSCRRCTYAPPAEDVHRYELVGEAGKKNGCKILRSQLWRRPEWSNVEMRREAAKTAQKAGQKKLAQALIEGRVSRLLKEEIIFLARLWNLRSDVWAPRGARATRNVQDADDSGDAKAGGTDDGSDETPTTSGSGAHAFAVGQGSPGRAGVVPPPQPPPHQPPQPPAQPPPPVAQQLARPMVRADTGVAALPLDRAQLSWQIGHQVESVKAQASCRLLQLTQTAQSQLMGTRSAVFCTAISDTHITQANSVVAHKWLTTLLELRMSGVRTKQRSELPAQLAMAVAPVPIDLEFETIIRYVHDILVYHTDIVAKRQGITEGELTYETEFKDTLASIGLVFRLLWEILQRTRLDRSNGAIAMIVPFLVDQFTTFMQKLELAMTYRASWIDDILRKRELHGSCLGAQPACLPAPAAQSCGLETADEAPPAAAPGAAGLRVSPGQTTIQDLSLSMARMISAAINRDLGAF